MHYYRFKIRYKGSAYKGWQRQPNDITVQGELEKAAQQIACSREVTAVASGRTDAGVHALAQVVRLAMPLDIDPEKLGRGLNSLLPQDIRVFDLEASGRDFNPIRGAKKKEYLYLFSPKGSLTPFNYEWVAPIYRELNEELMKEALSLIVGAHDFSHFQCRGTPVASTVREIFSARLLNHSLLDEELKLTLPLSHDVRGFSFEGSGFLKQMVRLLTGALWEIGAGRTSLGQLEKALNQELDKDIRLGPVAPSQGLYLKHVHYL